MYGVRVYSITVSQATDFIGIAEGIETPEVAALNRAVAKALEATEGGALGGTVAGVPFA